jgi:hypothetical protein
MVGYPAEKHEKQYRQAVGIFFFSTITINGLTSIFTQSVGVAFVDGSYNIALL